MAEARGDAAALRRPRGDDRGLPATAIGDAGADRAARAAASPIPTLPDARRSPATSTDEFEARAGGRRARQADAGGIRPLHRAERRLPRALRHSRSSSPCRAPTSTRSSPPSRRGSATPPDAEFATALGAGRAASSPSASRTGSSHDGRGAEALGERAEAMIEALASISAEPGPADAALSHARSTAAPRDLVGGMDAARPASRCAWTPPAPCTACCRPGGKGRGRRSGCSSARISTRWSMPAAMTARSASSPASLPSRNCAARGVALPFGLEVLAFGDEEGVRFPKTLIGSSTVAGALRDADARPDRRRRRHHPRRARRLRRRSRRARGRGLPARGRARLSRGPHRAGAGAGAARRAARRGHAPSPARAATASR